MAGDVLGRLKLWGHGINVLFYVSPIKRSKINELDDWPEKGPTYLYKVKAVSLCRLLQIE